MNGHGISIVVCCYNSASRIAETLKHVFELTIPSGCLVEVIVVNNNSQDDTKGEALKTNGKYRNDPLSFKIVDEPRPGLAFARMRGVTESKYDTLIFCDDDNHLGKDYLVVAKEVLDQRSEVLIAGGWAKPKFAGVPQPWTEDFYPAMAIGPQAPDDGFVTWVYGAGMVLRKSLFERIREKGISLQLSGRTGQNTSSGEDAELCILTIFLGYQIYYSSRLCLWHAVASHRLKKRHYLGAKFENVYPSIYLYVLHALTSGDRATVHQLYWRHIRSSVGSVFYFTPRIVLGKHRFYSLFMLYRSMQTLTWLAIHRRKFSKAYDDAMRNLSLSMPDFKLQMTGL